MVTPPEFPISATIAGVEVVTIPLADYAQLLAARRSLGRLRPPPIHRPSRLDRDAEVRRFVEDRLGEMPMETIVEECRRVFGPARTPGHSSVGRHWQKLRLAAPDHSPPIPANSA